MDETDASISEVPEAVTGAIFGVRLNAYNGLTGTIEIDDLCRDAELSGGGDRGCSGSDIGADAPVSGESFRGEDRGVRAAVAGAQTQAHKGNPPRIVSDAKGRHPKNPKKIREVKTRLALYRAGKDPEPGANVDGGRGRVIGDEPGIASRPAILDIDSEPFLMRRVMGNAWIRHFVLVGLAAGLAGCASRFEDSLAADGNSNGAGPTATSGEADITPRSAGRMQQAVMDFSDRFTSDIGQVFGAYLATEPDVAKQVSAQRLRLELATASMTIAASLDPRANLLDMAVFIAAGKWAADREWVPVLLGPKADGLRAAYARADREIWAEMQRVLTSGQIDDLRALIEAWKETARPGDVVDVRLRNLDGVVLSHFQEASSARGLLANVRRLLGKVDQSLLYGERMMFYVERTPLILSQQADLTVNRVAERFPIATVNPDFGAWSQAAQDFGRELPQRFSDALTNNEGLIREALPQLRGSLESVERISVSLQGTVASADSLATTVGKLPFKPGDYTAALERAATSLEKIDGILIGLNRLLDDEAKGGRKSPVAQLARLLDERTDRALDAVYERVAWLIAMFIGGLLIVLVVARILFPRPRAPKAG